MRVARWRSCELRHANLSSLGRLDGRLLAHFDGLATAGERGPAAPRRRSSRLSSRGAAFTLAVRAMEGGQPGSARTTLELSPPRRRPCPMGLVTAFGWVERRYLQGVVRDLLRNAAPRRREAGLAACAMHRADPGVGPGALARAIPVAAVRARAVRAVGELRARRASRLGWERRRPTAASVGSGRPGPAVLLGNRGVALEALRCVRRSRRTEPHRERAFRLTLQALDAPFGRMPCCETSAKDAAQLRWLIQGSGIAGDADHHVPVAHRTHGQA